MAMQGEVRMWSDISSIESSARRIEESVAALVPAVERIAAALERLVDTQELVKEVGEQPDQ